jgi:menaquinone-dependent protoporphyrinogen oxidase
MSGKILIAYASRSGTTSGVAKAISRSLAVDGFQADVFPVHEVKDISQYRAVIVGSAIQGGKWLPEAMDFVHYHQPVLVTKSVAAFQVCMTLAMPNAARYRSHVSDWMEPVRATIPVLCKRKIRFLYLFVYQLNIFTKGCS